MNQTFKRQILILILSVILSILPAYIESSIFRNKSRIFAEHNGYPINVTSTIDGGEYRGYVGDGIIVHQTFPLTDNPYEKGTREIENDSSSFMTMVLHKTVKYSLVIFISYHLINVITGLLHKDSNE